MYLVQTHMAHYFPDDEHIHRNTVILVHAAYVFTNINRANYEIMQQKDNEIIPDN